MALTYYLIPALFKREMILPQLAKIQPYLFGLSMYFFCLVMMARAPWRVAPPLGHGLPGRRARLRVAGAAT